MHNVLSDVVYDSVQAQVRTIAKASEIVREYSVEEHLISTSQTLGSRVVGDARYAL